MNAKNAKKLSLPDPLKVMFVIPAEASDKLVESNFIFSKREASSLQKTGVETRQFFLRSRTSLKTLFQEWKRFRHEVKSFGPDIIHAQFGTVTAVFSVLVANVPVVVSFRGSDLNPSPSVSWLRSVFGRFLSQVAAAFSSQNICVSAGLRRRLWTGKKRTTVIPSGVDSTIFFPISFQEARAKLNWLLEERVVLFNAGRFPLVKRLDLAQEAIDVACSLGGEVRFVVLDGHVQPNLIPLMMNGADCLLLTSDFEGSPTIVQEAIACNLPVVSVDVGDVRERLSKVVPSAVVEKTPQVLGRALNEILEKKKRSNGEQVVNDFSLERNGSRILSVYMKALKR